MQAVRQDELAMAVLNESSSDEEEEAEEEEPMEDEPMDIGGDGGGEALP